MIYYGKQCIDEQDINAVIEVLKSDFLTQGPAIEKFEQASEIVKKVTLPTKLVYSEYLSRQTGGRIYLKPENMQYTGAYKIRGAYYKISTLTEEARSFVYSGSRAMVLPPVQPSSRVRTADTHRRSLGSSSRIRGISRDRSSV